MAIPCVMLNNGVQMPQLGFGVFQIPQESCQPVVEDALELGYRLIDTASAYGNEQAVGAACKAVAIPRDELFITSKLWITQAGYDKAKRTFDATLAKLSLDYLDLYLIHQPAGDYLGAWRAMEELYEQGVIRAIGVANFSAPQLEKLLAACQVTPAVDQIECHPFCQQQQMHRWLADHDIALEGWAPFAEGRNHCFANPTLVAIAQAHGVSVAQVILRYQLDCQLICIPKTTHPDRMAQNLDVFGFSLTDQETQAIRALDTQKSSFFPTAPKWVGKLRSLVGHA